MKVIGLVAWIVMGSGCGTLSEGRRSTDENTTLLLTQQAKSLDELAALHIQLLEIQRRLECYINEIDVKQTCDLLSREVGDPAVRDNTFRRCMVSRGFERDLAACQ
jgi:hypothetical protein